MKFLRITVDQVLEDGVVSCFVAESTDQIPSWRKVKEAKADDPDWWGAENIYETTKTEFRRLTRRNASVGMVLLQQVKKEGQAGEYVNFSKQANRSVATDLWAEK